MDNTSQNMEFDNYDGQKFYYCTIKFILEGGVHLLLMIFVL